VSLLGLDIGTSGCKAVVFSYEGVLLAQEHREYDLIRPRPKWAEFNSKEVWKKVKNVIRIVASKTTNDPITTMSISSCGEAMTPVSKDRKILDNAILGFDERGSEYIPQFIDNIGEKETYYINGNKPSAFFSAPKLIWYKKNKPKIYDEAEYFLNWHDLVFFLLGCEPVTDFSLANRTLLFDLENEKWSEQLINAIGISIKKLPRPLPSGTNIGTVSNKMADELGLKHNVYCVTGGHDQCCNALGAGVISSGQAAYGIGTFICITPTFDKKPDMEIFYKYNLNIEHHVVSGHYVSFIYNMTGGSLIKWFRDEFSLLEKKIAQQNGTDVYDDLIRQIPDSPTDLFVLPYFAPTGSPWFDAKTPGNILGLRLETSRWQLLKALMEGVTYYIAEGMEIIYQTGIKINEYRPTGGGAKSNKWIQMKADIMGKPFTRPKILEASSLGAAMLAGAATGVYDSLKQAVENLVKVDKVFQPDKKNNEIYMKNLEKYKKMRIAIEDLFKKSFESN
jgi:xylulokinase